MILGVTATYLMLSTATVAAFATAVSENPGWASVANTFLLVILTFTARRNGKRAEDTSEIVRQVGILVSEAKVMAAEARQHAAEAAECSATTARIAKDVGRTLRK